MGYIFVLLLEKEKYYLGICNNPDEVHAYLVGERGPRWIYKYSPIKVVEIISPCDIFDLDKHTKRYMARYGLSNVRGGAYSGLYLSSGDKNHIDKEIFTALGMCMHCGSENHISNQCNLNNFSGQVKQVVHIVKSKFIDFKNKIRECVENYKNTRRGRNAKYNTLAINDEERPMMFVDSPKQTREVYRNEYEEDRKNLSRIYSNNSFIERLSDTDSLHISSSPELQSPNFAPISKPNQDMNLLSQQLNTQKMNMMTSNEILGTSLNSLLNIPEPNIDDTMPAMSTIDEIFHSFESTKEPIEINQPEKDDIPFEKQEIEPKEEIEPEETETIEMEISPSPQIDHPLL